MAGKDMRKVALVTGASSGIGRATAEAFIDRGYATALLDVNEEAGRKVEAQLRERGDCIFVRCDVADDEAVRQAVEQTVNTYGRLDAAFNAAAIPGEAKPTADCSMENWNKVIAIDLTGVWSCMRYEIRHMLKTGGGAIVNCSAAAGIRGAPRLPAYTAAKHGVVGLTKTAALEYARQGIRVNAVCPTTTETAMIPPERRQQIIEAAASKIPLGRLCQPSEIAAAVIWLCDDGASFVTGQAIAVDGGRSAH